MPAVVEVCQLLGIAEAAATVGVSFGGLQALRAAVSQQQLAPRLVLHSCAPSTLPYPDTALERLAAPLAFGPHTQRLTWRVVRALTSSDRETTSRSVPGPTLVTASHCHGGVSFRHAEDFVRTIPNARLVQTEAKRHFYWLGADRPAISAAVHDFMAG